MELNEALQSLLAIDSGLEDTLIDLLSEAEDNGSFIQAYI